MALRQVSESREAIASRRSSVGGEDCKELSVPYGQEGGKNQPVGGENWWTKFDFATTIILARNCTTNCSELSKFVVSSH